MPDWELWETVHQQVKKHKLQNFSFWLFGLFLVFSQPCKKLTVASLLTKWSLYTWPLSEEEVFHHF